MAFGHESCIDKQGWLESQFAVAMLIRTFRRRHTCSYLLGILIIGRQVRSLAPRMCFTCGGCVIFHLAKIYWPTRIAKYVFCTPFPSCPSGIGLPSVESAFVGGVSLEHMC